MLGRTGDVAVRKEKSRGEREGKNVERGGGSKKESLSSQNDTVLFQNTNSLRHRSLQKH